MKKKEYIENIERLIVNYLYNRYKERMTFEAIKDNFEDILIYDIQNKEDVVKDISLIIEDFKNMLREDCDSLNEDDVKKIKEYQELFKGIKVEESKKTQIEKIFGVTDDNVIELIKELKLESKKNSVIPGLLQHGKIVELNEKAINVIRNQIQDNIKTSVFSQRFIDPSSKNIFRFTPSEEDYQQYGLIGVKNTVNGEYITDGFAGSAAYEPYFKLMLLMKEQKEKNKSLEDMDIVKIFKQEHKNYVKKAYELFEKEIDDALNKELEEYEINSPLIQITIPIDESNDFDEDFITITPLHSLQQKGIIGEKIEKINMDKDNEYRINAKKTNLMMSNLPNITVLLSNSIKTFSLLSIPPTFNLDYEIKNIHWEFNEHNDLDDDSINQIKYYILNEIFESNLFNSKKIKNLYRMFEQKNENRHKKDYIYNSFLYFSLKLLNSIKKKKYEKYFKNKKEFAERFYSIYEDVLTVYFRMALSKIHAGNTNGYSKFEDRLDVLYKAINESFIRSNFKEKEIQLKTLKQIEENLEKKKEEMIKRGEENE